VPGAAELQGGAEGIGGLRCGEALGGQSPGGVVEGDALEADVLDEATGLRLAGGLDEALEEGRDDRGGGEVLVVEGYHAQLAGAPIELPLAGRVTGAGVVVDHVGAGGHAGLRNRPDGRPAEFRDARCRVDRLQGEGPRVPTEVEPQLDVGGVGPRLEVLAL